MSMQGYLRADGRKGIRNTIDYTTYVLLGAMADGQVISGNN